jgi:transposase InsO family protein
MSAKMEIGRLFLKMWTDSEVTDPRILSEMRGLMDELKKMLDEEGLEGLGGSCFLKNDLSDAYWSLKLHPDSRDLTTFRLRDGRAFRWISMTQGLSQAPAHFQNSITHLCNTPLPPRFAFNNQTTTYNRISGVIPYMDDTMQVAKSPLHAVVSFGLFSLLMDAAGFQMAMNKQFIGGPSIDALGRLVGPSYIGPTQAHVKAIEDLQPPTNRREVQKILGFFNYFNASVPDLHRDAGPLHELTRRNKEFEWTETHQRALEKLKKNFLRSAAIAPLDWGRPVQIWTDASGIGVAAVLVQHQNGLDEPPVLIAAWSRKLSPAEANWSAAEQETAAAVAAVVRWAEIVKHCKTTIVSDSGNLVQWMTHRINSTKGSAKIRFNNWRALLGTLGLEWVHRPGTQNVLADVLSRHPSSTNERLPASHPAFKFMENAPPGWNPLTGDYSPSKFLLPPPDETNFVRQTPQTGGTPSSHLYEATPVHSRPTANESVHLFGLAISLDNNFRISPYPTEDELKRHTLPLVPHDLAQNKTWRNVLSLTPDRRRAFRLDADKGFIFTVRDAQPDTLRIVLPESLVERTILAAHRLAHRGKRITARTVLSVFWFANAMHRIGHAVWRCVICMMRKSRFLNDQNPSIIFGRFANDAVMTDVTGPLPTAKHGMKYLLILMDLFSGYLQLIPMPSKQPQELVNAVLTHWFKAYGPPRSLRSDKGGEYENEVFVSFLNRWGTQHISAPPYRPQSQGAVERQFRHIKDSIYTLVEAESLSWPQTIERVQFQHNQMPLPNITASPHFLFHGRDPALRPVPQTPQSISMITIFAEFARQSAEIYHAKRFDRRLKKVGKEPPRAGLAPQFWQPGDLCFLELPPIQRAKIAEKHPSGSSPRFSGPWRLIAPASNKQWRIFFLDGRCHRARCTHSPASCTGLPTTNPFLRFLNTSPSIRCSTCKKKQRSIASSGKRPSTAA